MLDNQQPTPTGATMKRCTVCNRELDNHPRRIYCADKECQRVRRNIFIRRYRAALKIRAEVNKQEARNERT